MIDKRYTVSRYIDLGGAQVEFPIRQNKETSWVARVGDDRVYRIDLLRDGTYVVATFEGIVDNLIYDRSHESGLKVGTQIISKIGPHWLGEITVVGFGETLRQAYDVACEQGKADAKAEKEKYKEFMNFMKMVGPDEETTR